MRIKKKLSQHRRDFTAIYECDHCGFEKQGSGYDDTHFHQNVVPNWACPECGKKAAASTPRTAPDVPPHAVI